MGAGTKSASTRWRLTNRVGGGRAAALEFSGGGGAHHPVGTSDAGVIHRKLLMRWHFSSRAGPGSLPRDPDDRWWSPGSDRAHTAFFAAKAHATQNIVL